MYFFFFYPKLFKTTHLLSTMSKINLTTVPTKPGCYLYKNKQKKIIYIGKAKNLKKRVTSYFKLDHADSLKTQELVKHIDSVDFIITTSEVEALLLESRLIKQYKPKYNVDLKHNERYAYLKLTEEEYPRLITARKKTTRGEYFGPFSSGYNRILTLKTLNEVFALKTCKNSKERCFNSYIGLCSCPQFFDISKADYKKRLDQTRKVLKGKTSEVTKSLHDEMKQFAKSQKFELAKKRRDQIDAIESLQERQKVELHKEFDQDVIGYSYSAEKAVYFIFEIERGTIHKRHQYEINLDEKIELSKVNQEVIMQHYGEKQPPKQIVLNEHFFDEHTSELVGDALSQSTPYGVELRIPKKGDIKKLLDLANENADLAFAKEQPVLLELKKVLQLPTVPLNMECYDISNLRDEYIVGAKIQFTNGVPNKSLYRKYRIKWQTKQNDFAAMYEVIKRRLYRVKIGEEKAPDLIIIDGGRGQLNAALDARKEYGLSVPIISLAKREEEIYFPGIKKPLNTKNNKAKSAAIRLLIQMRDEVHRFVINYHRKLRDNQFDE